MWHHVTFSLAYFSLLLSWLSIEFKCLFTLSTVLAFRKSASCFRCWTGKQGVLMTVDYQWYLLEQAIQMRVSSLNLTKFSRLAYGSIPSCLRTTCSTNICRARITCHFILHITRKRGKSDEKIVKKISKYQAFRQVLWLVCTDVRDEIWK